MGQVQIVSVAVSSLAQQDGIVIVSCPDGTVEDVAALRAAIVQVVPSAVVVGSKVKVKVLRAKPEPHVLLVCVEDADQSDVDAVRTSLDPLLPEGWNALVSNFDIRTEVLDLDDLRALRAEVDQCILDLEKPEPEPESA